MRIISHALFFIATTCPLVMACSSMPQCTIKGTDTSDLDYVWLYDMEGNPIDSCAVTDGAFNFTTDRSTTQVFTIMNRDESARLPLIPDAKEIQVTIGDGAAAVTGSPLSEELQELQKWLLQQFNEANEKAMGLYADGKTEEGAAVMEEMHKTLADHCKTLYLNHLQDPVGIQAMTFLMDAIPDEEFIELYEKGGEIVRYDANLGGYYESLTISGTSLVQLQADGSFTEKEGTLDDIIGKGKYVLVDFWASWCGPCKEETPFVVKAYNDYKDKGLVVLGIPVRDKKDATKKAMVSLGIFYPQLLDPAGKLANQLDFHSIPHLFLFGPDGQIVKDGMRGGDIYAEGTDNGAGIGGGDDSKGAYVHIYGGTVEAKAGVEAAGKGGNAFGSSDDEDGTLEFHATNTHNNQTHYYKVSAGSSSNSLSPVNYQNQVSACWGNSYAKVEPCTSHNYSNGTCTWCGHTL